jgi:hypothetical protein
MYEQRAVDMLAKADTLAEPGVLLKAAHVEAMLAVAFELRALRVVMEEKRG